MYKIKKLATVTLAVLIFTVIPAGAFAAERQEAETAAHTHNYVYRSTSYGYSPNNDATHIKMTFPGYQCSVCGDTKVVGEKTEIQSHTMGTSHYSGANYHSGNLHYVNYTSNCIQCGHAKAEWKSYKCPGNGNCILPQSVTPVPVEK